MRILVVGGGFSKEREVSLRSSRAVFEALKLTDYQTEYLDWDGEHEELINACKDFNIVFPVLHGIGGEDGQIQEILEGIDIKFVGCSSKVSKVCIDKQQTKQLLAEHNILTPAGSVLDYQGYINSELSSGLHIVKPIFEGSSFDTFILNEDVDEDYSDKIKQAFADNQHMLVEEYIKGDEITAPILTGKDLPVIEIIPPTGQWFDYANKYNGSTIEACPPQNVSQKKQVQAKELANKVHEIVGARHFSRVDMIIRGDKIFVLEINTIPGMTSQSLFPKAASVAGMDMKTLVKYIVDLANKE